MTEKSVWNRSHAKIKKIVVRFHRKEWRMQGE